jgi:hypothetical protein
VWRVACGVGRVTCDVWRVACDVWRVACGVCVCVCVCVLRATWYGPSLPPQAEYHHYCNLVWNAGVTPLDPPPPIPPHAPCTPHTRCRRRSHPRCFCPCRRCRRSLAFVDHADSDFMSSSKRARLMMVQLLMLQGKCGCKYPRAARNERGPRRPRAETEF